MLRHKYLHNFIIYDFKYIVIGDVNHNSMIPTLMNALVYDLVSVSKSKLQKISVKLTYFFENQL